MSARHYEGQDLDALVDLGNYYAWITELLGSTLSGRVLEVGAGIGTFSAAYRPQVDALTLVEPSQLVERLAARFADDGAVTVHHGTLDEVLSQHSEYAHAFDTAVSVNVLEHVADDVAFLEDCRRAVKPGGSVLIAVPALPFLFGSLDELVHHHRRYTRTTLTRAVEAAGLELVRIGYFDILGVVPWWVTGRVLKRRTVDAQAARVYDRFGVPATRLFERLVPPPLGKNLACVARAPER